MSIEWKLVVFVELIYKSCYGFNGTSTLTNEHVR